MGGGCRLVCYQVSEVYDLFQLLCMLSPVFICFPPVRESSTPSRVIGACRVTTDCIVAMG